MRTISFILLFIMLPFASMADNRQSADSLAVAPAAEKYLKPEGDKAYDSKEYAKAVEIYENAIAADGGSANIYYNLGNAYFRLNEIGKAVLNYERALRIDPTDEDVKTNLVFAQNRTKDEVLEQHDLFFIEWFYAIVNMLGVDTWAVVAISAFLVLLIGVVLFLLSRKSTVRTTGLVLALLGLLVTLFSNIAALCMYNTVNDDTQAIVMKEEVTMMSAPGSSTAIIKVHEGRKVTVTDDSIDEWKEIELEDGTIGWVKSNDIERI